MVVGRGSGVWGGGVSGGVGDRTGNTGAGEETPSSTDVLNVVL